MLNLEPIEDRLAALGTKGPAVYIAARREFNQAAPDDVAALLEEVERLRTVVANILAEPYGCTHCDSGKPRNEAKGHQPDCPFELARAVIT